MNVSYAAEGSIIPHFAWSPQAYIPLPGVTHAVTPQEWARSPEQA